MNILWWPQRALPVSGPDQLPASSKGSEGCSEEGPWASLRSVSPRGCSPLFSCYRCNLSTGHCRSALERKAKAQGRCCLPNFKEVQIVLRVCLKKADGDNGGLRNCRAASCFPEATVFSALWQNRKPHRNTLGCHISGEGELTVNFKTQ